MKQRNNPTIGHENCHSEFDHTHQLQITRHTKYKCKLRTTRNKSHSNTKQFFKSSQLNPDLKQPSDIPAVSAHTQLHPTIKHQQTLCHRTIHPAPLRFVFGTDQHGLTGTSRSTHALLGCLSEWDGFTGVSSWPFSVPRPRPEDQNFIEP